MRRFFFVVCGVLVLCLFVCLVVVILLICALGSIVTYLTWVLSPKKRQNSRYRKFLRSGLREDLEEFKGNVPPLRLFISGPNGFDWRSAQFLKAGEEPVFEKYRFVPLKSPDWRGYVHYHLDFLRQKFIAEEIFPIISIVRTGMAFLDL